LKRHYWIEQTAEGERFRSLVSGILFRLLIISKNTKIT